MRFLILHFINMYNGEKELSKTAQNFSKLIDHNPLHNIKSNKRINVFEQWQKVHRTGSTSYI